MITISKGEMFQMPAGEWHMKSNDVSLKGQQFAYVRGGHPHDGILAAAVWADAVHRDGGDPVLLMPYLPGARQDRALPGEALTCKVMAEIINGCMFERVVCCDPHSDVMPALIERCVVVPIERIWNDSGLHELLEFDGYIAPDAGAAKRTWRVVEWLNKLRNTKIPVYQAMKHRDMATGKLSGFSCEELPSPANHEEPLRLLVVDDICDGGGTFMGLSEYIKNEYQEQVKLSLWVTHGVFSGDNAENLHKYFEHIYTTDSYFGAATARYNDAFRRKVKTVELFKMMRNLA